MDHPKLAKEILHLVGGKENVQSLTHCATRLRFVLNNNERADAKKLEQTPGVLKVVVGGGQFQVVIGSDVAEVYKHIDREGGFANKEASQGNDAQKTSLTSKIFSVISGSLSPLIPVFAGAGLVKALLIVLERLGWIAAGSSTYAILAAAGNSVFYFLPILLGVTIARVYNVSAFVAAAIGAALLEPNFTALGTTGGSTSFIGIPVPLLDYASSVFPMFIAVSLYAVLERFLKRIIHKNLQLFAVPFISLVIMVPLTAIIIGPFGVYVGQWIGVAVNFLINANPVIAGAILGGVWFFVVLLGLHWAVVPIIMSNLATGHGDVIVPLLAPSSAAAMGIALGVFLKTRDKDLKALGGSTFLSGILSGVTEPIMYGIILRYRKTLIYLIIASAVGGAVEGALGVRLIAFNFFVNVFTLPAQSPLLYFVIGLLVSLALAALLPLLFGYDTADKKAQPTAQTEHPAEAAASQQSETIILSPLNGRVIDLEQVEDAVFSSESMGKGIAIEPDKGVLVSPLDGKVAVTVGSSHAIAVRAEDGVEVLMHIGIDTVKLKGRHFSQKVSEGDTVRKGDVLIEFDVEGIKAEGFKLTTPIVITNTHEFREIRVAASQGPIQPLQELLKISK
ncbi:beta-glucoside-specific PTS transporter subunit IIABC [Paenibacillus macerans]|uniref:beta-glucoside-specific PTS transporter subunit IIABC n=1 Tax=Paenibacillus macerans TaxID=44252 RepID=UPI00203F948E|nr:beta-glucoside-specific PTS transporter subunit IIABC [Paenibacillus macerans]MCM3699678.1 beta-glucoside-specific PTS transporter subunit IIABC [Paenibacillus macerans]